VKGLSCTLIAVVNRCQQADGSDSVAAGVAWVRDRSTNARLEVSFLPAWLRWLPLARGDTWIIDLAPDYTWVVVGEPSRRFLWILARDGAPAACDFRSDRGAAAGAGLRPGAAAAFAGPLRRARRVARVGLVESRAGCGRRSSRCS